MFWTRLGRAIQENVGWTPRVGGPEVHRLSGMRLILTVPRVLLSCCLLACFSAAPLPGQSSHVATASSPALPAAIGPSDTLAEDLLVLDAPEPAQRGLNASAAFSGLYDEQLGWAGYVLPAIAYRFNSVFSADISIPMYFYRLGYKYVPGRPVQGPMPGQTQNNILHVQTGELGDTTVAGHMELSPGWLNYTGTGAFNIPTGDEDYGLSTGRVTYLVNNDFEAPIRAFTPDVQLGIGDNSDLVNRQVIRNYDTLGTLAYFQSGGIYNFPFGLILEGDAYEQLPLGNQKIYTNVIRKKKKVPLLVSNGNAEDNGVTVFLDMPFQGHLDVSSYFNHSFRLKDDTAGLTLTFYLKSLKKNAARPYAF
jgi:hypothetical protein